MRNKISLESKEPKQWEGMRENEKMKNLYEGYQHFLSFNFSNLLILYIPWKAVPLVAAVQRLIWIQLAAALMAYLKLVELFLL